MATMKALTVLIVFASMATAFTMNGLLNPGVVTKLRMHLVERSSDYASHIESMYQEHKNPSSHRHSFIQTSSKQARRRSRRLQRMHLKELTYSLNEEIV